MLHWSWQRCCIGRYPIIPAGSSPGSHEYSSLTRLPVQSTPPRHTAALLSALALCAGANNIQACCAGVWMCQWTHAGLTGWRSTACHWTSWSTTRPCVHHRPLHWSYHWQECLRSATEHSTVAAVCHQKWHHQSVSDHSRLNDCFPPLSAR